MSFADIFKKPEKDIPDTPEPGRCTRCGRVALVYEPTNNTRSRRLRRQG